jgi:hypothetical protein
MAAMPIIKTKIFKFFIVVISFSKRFVDRKIELG